MAYTKELFHWRSGGRRRYRSESPDGIFCRRLVVDSNAHVEAGT